MLYDVFYRHVRTCDFDMPESYLDRVATNPENVGARAICKNDSTGNLVLTRVNDREQLLADLRRAGWAISVEEVQAGKAMLIGADYDAAEGALELKLSNYLHGQGRERIVLAWIRAGKPTIRTWLEWQ